MWSPIILQGAQEETRETTWSRLEQPGEFRNQGGLISVGTIRATFVGEMEFKI